MTRHTPSKSVNPYINRRGNRRSYCPNRARTEEARPARPPKLVQMVPLRGSGRGATTPQALARAERKRTEAARVIAPHTKGRLPKLAEVLAAARARLLGEGVGR